MITRVLDRDGQVLHDCTESGCEVSWDGYLIATGEPIEGRSDPPQRLQLVGTTTARLLDVPARG